MSHMLWFFIFMIVSSIVQSHFSSVNYFYLNDIRFKGVTFCHSFFLGIVAHYVFLDH